MKFVDEATITVESGDGGRGCVSFRREKFIPRGGPDGGDGGKGGDILLRSTSHRRTLYQFRYKQSFRAKNGGYGQGSQKTGKDGENLIIEVPVGTLVMDAETGRLIHDFVAPDQTLTVARGGRGGRGNSRFKSSTNRAPRYAQPGEAGETLTLRVELRLLADVGLIGLPNAGKSTLISGISSATPKIADYPFTTLVPNLGVVKPGSGEPFVVADIPGLIEGAHAGVGLGIKFLRHIERTRILLHLIDAAAIDPEAPMAGYDVINRELSLYSASLAGKTQIVVLNKLDLTGAPDKAQRFESVFPGRVFQISAATRAGVDALVSQLVTVLDRHDEAESENLF